LKNDGWRFSESARFTFGMTVVRAFFSSSTHPDPEADHRVRFDCSSPYIEYIVKMVVSDDVRSCSSSFPDSDAVVDDGDGLEPYFKGVGGTTTRDGTSIRIFYFPVQFMGF
jgi:hypothetical protein